MITPSLRAERSNPEKMYFGWIAAPGFARLAMTAEMFQSL
jgi:hypothetical protein